MSYVSQFAAAVSASTVETLTVDVGGAISPIANNINLFGGNVITTSGAGNTIAIDLDNGTDGQLLIGGGSDPTWATLSSADSSIVIAAGANTLDVTVSGIFANSFPTDSGTATPSSGVLTVSGGGDGISTSGAAAAVTVSLSTGAEVTAIHGWNGSLLETADCDVTSDGVTITFSIELSGGGDLTAVFSDGYYAWDTTPADTVTLTAGSDTSPQLNYVYLLQSTKTLTASTAGWPATEHAPLATVLCQSAASLQTDGPYKVHAWTDHVTQSNNQGHISDINYWIRYQNATWLSGVAQTLTITPNGGAPDNVIFTSSSGVVLQLHDHTFPAFAGTPDIYTVNDSVTPYNIVTDLNALLTDSTGASMSGRYFSLVIWGVVSEDTADCKLMVNLPSGSYNNASNLTADSSKFANFTIPTEFKGTGFLIAQYNLRHQAAASGTWTEIDFIDLRGLFPASSGGSGTALSNEFIDNVFRILDDSDTTKEIAFQASGITTATTRTITMADRDIDLTPMADTFTSDSGSAVASAGVLTVSGGTNIATTGAASTLTINFDGTLPVASGGTGATTLTDHGVLIGSGTGAVTVSAVGTNGQLLIGATGADPAFATLTSSNSTISISGGANTLDIDVSAPLNVATGGTGRTSHTAYAVICGGTTSTAAQQSIASVGTSGQVLTSNGAGALPTFQDAGGGGITWNEETGTSATMAVDNGYIANNAALVTLTLPDTAAVGSVVRVTGKGAGGWKIAQNASEIIHFGTTDTTTGVGGSLASTETYDAVELVCIVADTEWVVLSSLGNITIV